MTSPTAMIADDENNLRAYLREQLARLWPELIIVAEAANGDQALARYREWSPDFVFLDIKMPGISGMDVAQRITGCAHIVFITAYDQYAAQAFEQAAVDYLLKPVTEERLSKTVERLKQRFAAAPHACAEEQLTQLLAALGQTGGEKRHLQWIKATRHGNTHLISVDEIDYFQSSDKYTTVVTTQGEWVIRTPLVQLEKQLDPDRFWRIHRGIIVRVEAIEAFERTFAGRPVVRLRHHDQALSVSRSHEERFKAD